MTNRFIVTVLLVCCFCIVQGGRAYAAPLELYFEDGFDPTASKKYFFEGTLDNRVFSYEGGEYQIDTMRTDAYGQSILLEDLSTYSVETTGRLLESSDDDGGGFGISFNYRERDGGSDFLLFLVYNRGAYTVLRYSAGRTSVLYSPTKTRAFNPGESVALRVDSTRGSLRFFLNGIEVAKLVEDGLISGGLGLFAAGRSTVRFDDFRVFAEQTQQPGFADDFAGSKRLFEGNWEEISYGYSGGQYVVDTSRAAKIGLSPFPEPALDFEFAVDALQLGGDPLGTYGIFVRDHPNELGGFDQLRFLIGGSWFAVERSEGDRPLALTEWQEHPAIRVGQTNRLRAQASGGEVVFYINDEEVYRLQDTPPHEGNYGFFVSAGLKVAFDNVEFMKQR